MFFVFSVLVLGIYPKRALVQSQASFTEDTEKAFCGFFVVQAQGTHTSGVTVCMFGI